MTQVTFNADEKLKRLALSKAKSEGLTLKTVLVFALKGYVDNKIKFGLEVDNHEPEVEELHFNDPRLHKLSAKIVKLLK